MSILFDEIVFGPVNSRRFGISLGINLLPTSFKYCTFNCIYCECGWTKVKSAEKVRLFSRVEVKAALEKKCAELVNSNIYPDNLTFAGNGEPTIHPEFPGIIDDTLAIRNTYFPQAEVTVLSNSSLLHKPAIRAALKKVDKNVLKLDCGTDKMFQLLNRPLGKISLSKIIGYLKSFDGPVIIQTLFIRGEYEGIPIDNTTPEEIHAWLNHIRDIHPILVLIYPIARQTPVATLKKIGSDELQQIAKKVETLGIPVQVYQ
jgi:wyosine [tRNA(Phe)-imidazoG37] synthetase (radical SAM superfamily)